MRSSTVRLPVALFALITAVLGSGAAAQNWDGQLDRSFGTFSGFGLYSGKIVIAWPEPGVQFLLAPGGGTHDGQIAVQQDGRLVVAAPVQADSGLASFGVLRLLDDGSLDTDFGSGGVRRHSYLDSYSFLHDMVLRPSGEILLTGVVRPAQSGERMAVAQLTSNGDLDTTFGLSGWLTVPFGLPNEGAFAIALQPDGKVLLAGATRDDVAYVGSMALARVLANGQPDLAFGNNGRVLVSLLPNHPNGTATDLRVLDDGRILMVGAAGTRLPGNTLTFSMALARVLPDGTLDSSFGSNGLALHNIGTPGQSNTLDLLTSVDVQADGRIVACGFSGTLTPNFGFMACLRFLANGQVDPGYEPALINFQLGHPFALAARVRIDPQGRALVAGRALRSADNADFALARLREDGTLDPAFGVGGRVSYDRCSRGTCLGSNPNNHDLDNPLFGMALLPDGRIVLAGSARQPDGSVRLLVTRSHGDRIFAGDLESAP